MFFRPKTKYTVYTYGAEVLRKPAAAISEVTPEIRETAAVMFRTMQLFDGIGFAGPQSGVGKRLITLMVPGPSGGAVSPGEALLLPRMPLAIINPEIIAVSDVTDIVEEGCLSIPRISAPVERAQFIRFRALTLDGEALECECGGLLARCLQHEFDHLNGILFVDRLAKEVFRDLEPQLQRLQKTGRKKDFKKTLTV
ncbi:MAG: peptide deformylase [Victivallaceae bacterium]|nr:peptide deformylase [Victivallaceae bacterium]